MACKYPTPAFNRRVAIQSPAGSRDAYGERTTTWSTVAFSAKRQRQRRSQDSFGHGWKYPP